MKRFHLDISKPRRKYTCPACGRRKCFTRYVDEEGLIEFPEEVGRCDRLNNCAYHYPPHEYFRDHPELSSRAREAWQRSPQSRKPAMPERPEPSLMPGWMMEASCNPAHYPANNLYLFLADRFGKATAEERCLAYHVGTARTWPGAAVFWQVDGKGRPHAAKVICYDRQSGHRLKRLRGRPDVIWAHTMLRCHGYVLEQCYFGEHLLPLYPRCKVMMVESEKSALIGSIFMPDYVWVACGGLENLRVRSCLRGREVLLLPDLKGEDRWAQRLPQFRKACRSVGISTFLSERATDAQRAAGLDIADFLLAGNTPP